jgi:uncharacterized protein with HEPN domain
MSGEKKWLFRIADMIDAIGELQAHLAAIPQETFMASSLLQKATERYFEIIGEAARFVPKDIQNNYSEIDWYKIIGMRHKISHDYLEVSPEILWSTYQSDLEPLKQKLQHMLEQEDK